MRLPLNRHESMAYLKRACRSALAGCFAMALAQPVLAQSNDSTSELKAEITQMRQQMQAQQDVIRKMQQRLDELEAKEASQEKAASTATAKPAAPSPTPTPTPLLTPAAAPATVASSGYRPPSAPAGVSEPMPEGYVRLGDTGSLLKIDLVAQLDTMIDNKYMGSRDAFLPSSIPVQGQPFYNTGWRTNLSARQSLFRMDFRRESDYGTVKVVYKNNFFGSGSGDMPYNLQFFYGELDNERFTLLAGYNISAFTDIAVFPNTLDFEGPNSFTFKYGPQLRFSPYLYKSSAGALTLPMSIEKPNADIAVANGYAPYSRRADFTLGLRWEAPNWHVQWANLLRDLGVQNGTTGTAKHASGYATQLTGSSKLFERDSVQAWGSYGKGYANFLQDISGLGLDAAFNTSGDLKAIKARGYGAGYTHGWTDTLSSSLAYGYLRISPSSNMLIENTLPRRTEFASVNLAWQFTQRTMLGIEYLWGQNMDLTNARGEGQRVQTSLRYDLNP
jgi:hypothetical protein